MKKKLRSGGMICIYAYSVIAIPMFRSSVHWDDRVSKEYSL